MRIGVDSFRLHCDVAGAGPPVLFIHGFPLSGRMWRMAIERLAPRFRCYVPDLRGHGLSDVSHGASIARYADDLNALLDALGEPRPVALVGLSMGGIIAFEFFRRFRTRVAALALCDTRSNAESPEGVQRREAVAQSALRDGARAVADQMIEVALAPDAAPQVRAEVHEMMCCTPALGIAAASRALATRPDSEPTLVVIDVPTLALVGDQDALTSPESMRVLHRGIRTSKFVVIPGAGHIPPLERPAEFTSALGAFLDEVFGERSG